MRKSLTLSLAAAATLIAGGAAYAQSEPRPESRGETTRAEAEARSAEMFGRMDANDDGVLNEADREATRREAFDRLDTDRDGSISFAEFESGKDQRRESRAERGGHRGDHRRDFGRGGFARAADADSDGTVTQAEFTTAALARFDRADANSDGTISADERRDSRRDSRHERRRGRSARDAG